MGDGNINRTDTEYYFFCDDLGVGNIELNWYRMLIFLLWRFVYFNIESTDTERYSVCCDDLWDINKDRKYTEYYCVCCKNVGYGNIEKK